MGTWRGRPGGRAVPGRRPGGTDVGGRRDDDTTSDERRAGDEGDPPRPQVGRPRPAVPTGRAALGALLVVAAAVGALAVGGRSGRAAATRYVVVRHDVDAGAILRRDDLALAALEVPATQAGRLVRDPRVLEGTVALGPLAAGELVQRGAVATVAGVPGSRELSFAVDPARAAGGRVRSGDRVDVLATFGSGQDAHTEQVAAKVLVVHADASASSPSGRAGLTLTLSVPDPGVALALAHATTAGTVTVVRSTGVPR